MLSKITVMLIQAEKNALESVLIYVEHIIRYIGKVSSLSGWQFLPAYDIIWKSIIFPSCLILTQHQLYLFFSITFRKISMLLIPY